MSKSGWNSPRRNASFGSKRLCRHIRDACEKTFKYAGRHMGTILRQYFAISSKVIVFLATDGIRVSFQKRFFTFTCLNLTVGGQNYNYLHFGLGIIIITARNAVFYYIRRARVSIRFFLYHAVGRCPAASDSCFTS